MAEINRIICGNALDVLRTLPDNSVSCIITSPPYFRLRKYGCEFDWGGDKNCEHDWRQIITKQPNASGGKTDYAKQKMAIKDSDNYSEFVDYGNRQTTSNTCIKCGCWHGELGLEPTIDMFIDHLISIFNECKRVLRPDGTCWVNIADKYATGSGAGSRGGAKQATMKDRLGDDEEIEPVVGIPAKSMCGIPERFMLKMMESGWILRQKIIWVKGISFCDTYAGSCMPDSAKDRFNKNGFEPLYFFTKTGNYWFEQQYEDAVETNEARPRMGQSNQTRYAQKISGRKADDLRGDDIEPAISGSGVKGHSGNYDSDGNLIGGGKRILRNVWAINPEPSTEKHYAAYPTALVEPCIKAGCPKEICVKCSKPRMPIYELGELLPDKPAYKSRGNSRGDDFVQNAMTPAGETKGHPNFHYERKGITYSDCGCNAGFSPGIVMDIFGGTGTVGYVAVKLKRNYILIEGKQEYIDEIANLKLAEAETGVTVDEQRQGQKGLFA